MTTEHVVVAQPSGNGHQPQPPARHPLDPLTAEEVAAAAEILKAERDLGAGARFVFVMLHEPSKDVVRAWTPGAPVPRAAFVVLRDRDTRGTYEAVVDLDERRVLDFTRADGLQAPITFEEFMSCEETVRADPRWQAAMR